MYKPNELEIHAALESMWLSLLQTNTMLCSLTHKKTCHILHTTQTKTCYSLERVWSCQLFQRCGDCEGLAPALPLPLYAHCASIPRLYHCSLAAQPADVDIHIRTVSVATRAKSTVALKIYSLIGSRYSYLHTQNPD